MSKRIAVIGAGAAGLAAAWRLSRAGCVVVVHERSAVPGGLLQTAERGGVRADTGVQLLASTYEATFALARATGADGLLVRASGHDAVWRKGGAHGITYGSVASMAASGALPALLKLKLAGKYVPWLASHAGRLNVNDLPGTAAAADHESIATWGLRELGGDFVEYLVYPLLAAYYGTPPEAASAAFYHALAREGMHVTVHAMRDGAGGFAAAVGAGLERAGVSFRYGSAAAAVAGPPASPVLNAGGSEWPVDGVVIATPPAAAVSLVSDESARGWLARVRTRPAVAVVLWLDARVRVPWFGCSFPRRESPGNVLAAACVQSRKLDFGAASGDAVVVFPAPAWLDHGPSDAELADRVPAALEQVLPGLKRVLQEVEVRRLEGGYRQFPPGHISQLAQSPPPASGRVVLAGDYLVSPTVEGAVLSGLRAAEQLLAIG